MEWSRTVRIDAANDVQRRAAAAALSQAGVHVRWGERTTRLYGLVLGSAAEDPDGVRQRLPAVRWYDEAIIALAIEPSPSDALPQLAAAIGGAGAPAGMLDCAIERQTLFVEMRPSITHPRLILDLVDAELRRFGGTRRIRSLAPLPPDAVARIAAQGLQAPDIGEDRVLEVLLERAHVE